MIRIDGRDAAPGVVVTSVRWSSRGGARLRMTANRAEDVPPGSTVTLRWDDPSQDTSVRERMTRRPAFHGRIAGRGLRTSGTGTVFTAEAVDGFVLAGSVTARGPGGVPGVGANLPVGHAWHDPQRCRLTAAELLAGLAATHAEPLGRLGAVGPGAAWRAGDLAALPTVWPAVSPTARRGAGCGVRRGSVAHLVRQIAAGVPGLRVWTEAGWNDAAQAGPLDGGGATNDACTVQWRCAAAGAGPVVELSCADAGVRVDMTRSLLPAARELCIFPSPCRGEPPYDGHAADRPGRRLQWRTWSAGHLVPAWDARLQATWTRTRAAVPDPASAAALAGKPSLAEGLTPEGGAAPDELASSPGNPYRSVWRIWRLAEGCPAPDAWTQVRLMKRTNTPPSEGRWEPVAHEWDGAMRTVTAGAALLSAGDPDSPGSALPVADVAMVFETPADDNGTVEPLARVTIPDGDGAMRRIGAGTEALPPDGIGHRRDSAGSWGAGVAAAVAAGAGLGGPAGTVGGIGGPAGRMRGRIIVRGTTARTMLADAATRDALLRPDVAVVLRGAGLPGGECVLCPRSVEVHFARGDIRIRV